MIALILGLIATLLGILFLGGIFFNWWIDFLDVLANCFPPALILGGIIAIVAGISNIKKKITEKKAVKEKK